MESMMDMSIKPYNLLSTLNSPDIAGVIPGSMRTASDTRRVAAPLRSDQMFTFNVSEVDISGAVVGSRCELVVLASTRKADGTNVLTGDAIQLVEEASNLVWRDISLVINGQEIVNNVRADITRHVLDRYHNPLKLLGTSPTEYRQLNADSTIPIAAGTLDDKTLFKKDAIIGGSRFELIRPLDDIPFFAFGDSLIPGFNVIQIRAKTTSAPQSLFKTTSAITNAPVLFVEEVSLRYTTVKLEEPVAQQLQAMSVSGELEINGTRWSATNVTPRIDQGMKYYTQGVSVDFATVPNVAYFMSFPENSFIPDGTSYRTALHPLAHSWANMSSCSIIDGGGNVLREYRNMDGIGGKAQLLNEMGKAIEALDNSTPAAIQNAVFVNENGVGAVPLVHRKWNEQDTHRPTPMSLRIRAELNDIASTAGAPSNAQPFIVACSRHRWVLNTTSGKTKIVL